MSKVIEEKIDKIPIVRHLAIWAKKLVFPKLDGLSLYDILELYIFGIIKGAFSDRSAAIAFNFFMALFPFALFILNLVPYMPIENFQEDFFEFLSENVPPNTFDAVSYIIADIMTNSNNGLLSSGIFMTIALMANGFNSVLGGFQNSYHVKESRSFIRQFFVAMGLSILLSVLLISTVAAIVIFEVVIQFIQFDKIHIDRIYLLEWGRYAFVVLMILTGTSIILKFGSKELSKSAFISVGSVVTTIMIVLASVAFSIYVENFARYNELYGSIGTLLVLMIYIWLLCVILLLGYELNATIYRLKRKKQLYLSKDNKQNTINVTNQ